jgi:hypothetical protein
MMHLSTVGTAPGTTTLTFGRGGRRGLGSTIPTDIDKQGTYGYLPVTTGVMPGQLVGLGGLGEDPAAMEAQIRQLQLVTQQLEVAQRQEELKTQRSTRIWTAVAGLVGVAGLVVSIYSLKNRR